MAFNPYQEVDRKIVLFRQRDNARLTTLVKLVIKYEPLLDKQVALAHVINTLTEKGFRVTKSEILYCFNKNYNKEWHGDKRGYLLWLGRLMSK